MKSREAGESTGEVAGTTKMVFEWRQAPAADFAVIGNPVGHSLSPVMHQAIYDELGLNYRYCALEVQRGEVSACLNLLSEIGYRGVNVTVPHKTEALVWSKLPDPFCREVRTANTMDLRTRSCINTDAPGFLETLADLDLQPDCALILGAGGTSRSLVAALAKAGWRLKIHNRTRFNAVGLCDTYGAELMDLPDPEGCSLIVNATSASMNGEVPPVLWDRAQTDATAYDLMYSKDPTPFEKAAHRVGLRAVNGVSLLVAQGALSFEWWTAKSAPRPVMRGAVVAALNAR